jgi:hypothetical protein
MLKAAKFLALAAIIAASTAFVTAQDRDGDWDHGPIRHVLLISIDGWHAVDLLNCSQGMPAVNDGKPWCPHLAALRVDGVNYVAASTSKPSDSFPGLMTIMSGATPRTMGVYYDVAYDRTLDGPAVVTGNGNGPGPCTAGAAATGFSTEFDEGIDIDKTKLNGGAPGAGLTDGGIASIDQTKLDRDPRAGCAPVYPWNFVRTNTIFGVIHAAGGYTAWSDKHPSYSAVAGPGGGTLNDYYAPEINSTVVPLPNVQTPEGLSCETVPDPTSDTSSWTNSFENIQCYDTLKVHAILREIDGKDHDGNPARTPTIFGMNFQAVSVGQKLIESGFPNGGYTDAAGTPGASLLSEMEFVDDSIGEMVSELRDHGLDRDTLIVITAKHGQSPIDPNLYFPIPGKTNNGSSPATLLENMLPYSESPANSTGLGPTEDDVSLLWLKPGVDVSTAVATLEGNRKTAGIGQIYYGASLALNYNWPGLPPTGDPRTPDILVTPNVGVTYTGSASKLAEHGGFAHDDTNAMLLLANPELQPRTVYSAVGTMQIAPTILSSLGLDPQKLDGVRLEGTPVLPYVQFDDNR